MIKVLTRPSILEHNAYDLERWINKKSKQFGLELVAVDGNQYIFKEK